MELIVNGGTVPISVDKRNAKLFTASFMPTTPGPHIIQMMFNGLEVSGKLH